MHDDSAIAKRFILGAVKNLPREIYLYMNDLRMHFSAFSSPRLVWNEVSPLTARMLQFHTLSSVNTAFKAGSFEAGENVAVLAQIWLEVRAQILKAALMLAEGVNSTWFLSTMRVRSV